MNLADPFASQTALIAILAVVAVLGICVAVYVLLPGFIAPRFAREDLGTHRLEFGAWLTVIVLNALLAIPLAPFLHLDQGLTAGTFVIAALTTDVPMLIIIYVRLILPRAVTWTELGLKPLPLDTMLRYGLGGGLVGLLAIDLVGGLLAQLGLRPNQLDQFEFVLSEGPLSFVVLLIAAAVVAPVVEELFFRGFLFGIYRRRQPVWLAYLVSSVLFTILHLEPNRMNVPQMAGLSVGIFMLAILLCWLYQRTGSLYPGMIAHAVNNAAGLILFYSFGLR